MSLINRMLQDLDARRSDGGDGAAPYSEQVRAVPERRGIHPAWWVALALAIALVGLVAWLVLRQAAPVQALDRPRLPLKLDTGIEAARPVSAPAPVTPTPPSASNIPKQAIALPQPDSERPADPPTNPQPNHSTPVMPREQAVAAAPVDAASKATSEGNPSPAGKRTAPKVTTPMQAEAADLPHVASSTPDQKKATGNAKVQPTASAQFAETVPAPVELNKQVREPTPQQRAENEYRKALLAMQQGRSAEAITGLEHALQLDPQHAAARQTLIGALVDAGRVDDAMRRTREALQQDPSQAGLAMVLARLQMEKKELGSAIETLERTLPYGADRADYQAFLAALLQRDQRHKEATQHYLLALKSSPQNGVWWMGLGISLQADNRLPEAQEAFKRAKASNTLSAELQAFVDNKLAQLKQ